MLRVINAIEEKTGLTPVPIETKNAEKCVVYRYHKTAKYSYRLELRVMASTFKECKEIADKIYELEDFGDETYIDGVSISLNGGGTLKDYENNMIQTLIYFDVITKGV